MIESREGERVPQVRFQVRRNGDWETLTTDDLFKGQTVVLFALPGAFTPTCSTTHLPRYNELAGVFRQEGVDRIICLSVNDPFVMEAWSADQRASDIQFIPDGNGDFSRGMGTLVSKTELGFGDRSWRYSMLVRDGTIEKMFIEPDKPGDPFEVSDADTMLHYIRPDATVPSRVALFTKPGCPHCKRARELLDARGYNYEEVQLGSGGLSYSSLQAITGRGTTPQVFIDGRHIGGADDLERTLPA